MQKPDQLNVPVDKFQEHFGVSWEEALKSGKVFNAMDGCQHLGIDAQQLNVAWSKAKAAKKLIKFGGGFYCGLVEVEGKEPVYIFNGFFMAMRSKFTAPSAEVYYYLVEWDANALSWADFRGKVLGPTDPAEAPAESLRGQILSKWEELGLKEKPNVGDNGMHASASPFEGFAERNNWLEIPIKDDPFGARLLQRGFSESLIQAWSVDPQVQIAPGKQGSVFDQLEDLDTAACLEKLLELKDRNLMNAAFVFIKPHAMTEKVKELAKTGLQKHGIKILKEGSLKAETIDQKKLIDQHYYAIASKATILKPDQLNVPADKFQEQFGVSWEEALKSGKVFNAMDGCQHLGIDAGEMDAAWSQAKAAKKLIKFGGGFYCGLVEVEGKEPVYIFNGFFMAMRSKFTKPGSSIHYFSVEWDANALSWADFRGKVLGPTDPAEAPAESLRGQILSKWEELGLKEKPNVGDNGMHASASPFEGFAERNNWLEIPIKDDPFGARLLQRGFSESLIQAWSVDPQVQIAPGKQGSVFDQLEDLDTAACLEKLLELKDRNLMNAAFVFIKPHAMTEKVKELAKTGLQKHGIKILKEGSLKAETIDQKKLIDQHYYAIASKATILKPDQLNVPADKFQEQFGVSWEEALKSGKVFNAMDGCQHLGIDAGEMDAAWSQAKAAKKLIKFGGGFYCGLVEVEGKEPVYIFNGFFMAMRSKFTKPGSSIHYFSVEWDANALSWADFRGKVLGPTDPAEAPAESLRGQILSKWEELGLKEKPNVGDNGMHASASPFEGFAERNNWLEIPIKDDPFGARLLQRGFSESLIQAWSVDPQVQIAPGKQGSVFDQLEDLDTAACLEKLLELKDRNLMNAAFVFIKPHAMTEKVKELAKTGLQKHGIKILKEGSLKAETIDQKKLIDQHYYAIASKATILKPDQLNVPADKFQEQFGVSWEEALKSGKVFNAMDGCQHLGIDAGEMDAAWSQAKAAKKLIKFGGGFYCGLVEVEGKEPVYIFNGFFMAMRSKFTKPGSSIHYFSVEWDANALSWADFRGKVLGPTDPAEAPAESLRGQILSKWEELGLKEKPNVGDNGMHASASPFEGFAERHNWLSQSVQDDTFGARCSERKRSCARFRFPGELTDRGRDAEAHG